MIFGIFGKFGIDYRVFGKTVLFFVKKIDIFSSTVLALTMKCARCHTHKYDPITQEEYYRFYDYFNQSADADTNDDAPTIAVPGTEEGRQKAALQAQIDQLQAQQRDTSRTDNSSR